MKPRPIWIVLAITLASIALLMKMNLVPGGGTILIVSLSALAILFFFRARGTPEFALESRMQLFIYKLLNYTFSLMAIAILFRYQWYHGWNVYFMIGIPTFLICSILALSMKGTIWIDENKKAIRQTILIPWIFIFITTGLHIYLSSEKFYNTFSYRRANMSYQQFVDSLTANPPQGRYSNSK